MHEIRAVHRRGIALPISLAAVVLMGVIVSAVFFSARQRTLISIALADGTRASALADMAESRGWESVVADSQVALAPGESGVPVTISHTDGSAVVQLTRLNGRIFALVSEGRGTGNVVRRTMTFIHVMPPDSLADSLAVEPRPFVASRVALRSWADLF